MIQHGIHTSYDFLLQRDQQSPKEIFTGAGEKPRSLQKMKRSKTEKKLPLADQHPGASAAPSNSLGHKPTLVDGMIFRPDITVNDVCCNTMIACGTSVRYYFRCRGKDVHVLNISNQSLVLLHPIRSTKQSLVLTILFGERGPY